ncbi:major facilitator superfamily domain-containing protein [Penicillium hetheringtonii]|uniref:Major facilitator superfamily domain-containing protein n=1 Tax=Penicillium hetheringtonii TaxID=911720 RepID=A0AAD6DRU0_9EURO|nr:major facilitator superfamily domain-containing protein [Penicillium hetheringtonii]
MKPVDPSPTTEWGSTIHGLRLYLGATGLGLALFLTCLEATIVSTSLVTITDDLQDSNNSSWIITSYLLTYTGFLIVWSNCSSIVGVKTAVLASLSLFIGFSAACAASQTLNQLIIFRALQGLGGAGVYSLTLFSFVRIVPYKHFDKVSSLAGGISSLGLVLGPLLGGAIANNGSWRWVFLYNVPVGVLSWIFTYYAIPSHFPNAKIHNDQDIRKRLWLGTKSFFRRVDLLGSFLTLTACSFIIAALQEGNSQYSWNSPLVISFFRDFWDILHTVCFMGVIYLSK